MLDQIIRFSRQLVPYTAKDTTDSINPKLLSLSSELNVQFYLYSSQNPIKIINNHWVDALIISIFQLQRETDLRFYCLYHTEYKTISQESHNTSEEFIPQEPEINYIWLIEETIRTLTSELRSRTISDEDKSGIRTNFQQLNKNHYKNWSFEENITNSSNF